MGYHKTAVIQALPIQYSKTIAYLIKGFIKSMLEDASASSVRQGRVSVFNSWFRLGIIKSHMPGG